MPPTLHLHSPTTQLKSSSLVSQRSPFWWVKRLMTFVQCSSKKRPEGQTLQGTSPSHGGAAAPRVSHGPSSMPVTATSGLLRSQSARQHVAKLPIIASSPLTSTSTANLSWQSVPEMSLAQANISTAGTPAIFRCFRQRSPSMRPNHSFKPTSTPPLRSGVAAA
jgi:hypothetical protein